jgi:hypothetical protein
MLTPFARGLLGWTTRVPLWFFCANRPRAGKDYLAAITLLIYEGIAFEDMPLGKDAEETCKRIISAARNGRRFMHFSNCQFYLQDQYLAQVVTNPMISGRSLGANSAQSDLQIPNEMEFSLSGNVDLSYREDFENRLRKIELAYFEEDFNSREFKNPLLHQSILRNRGMVLSAIAGIYQNWATRECPRSRASKASHYGPTSSGAPCSRGPGDPACHSGEYDNVGGQGHRGR